MQRFIPFIILWMLGGMLAAQNDQAALQREINQQVWFPFMQYYATLNQPEFMKIHSKDIVRINRDRQRIRVGEEYAEDIKLNMQWNRENEITRRIEFAFTERFAMGDEAFEEGFYKVTNTRAGENRVFYGKFSFVLRKESGKWKILMDMDTSNQGEIGEADFKSAKKLR